MCIIEEFCGCCYLSTGVVFVCCFYLVFFLICYNTNSFPVWTNNGSWSYYPFNFKNPDGYQWYYIVGIAVALFALLGVFTKKRILLIPLIWFDVVRSIFTAVVYIVNFSRSPNLLQNSNNDMFMVFIAALQVYAIILEISFYKELQKMRYNNGLVIIDRPLDTSALQPTAPPCAPEIPPEQCHFINPTPVAPIEYNIPDPCNYPPYMQVCPQAPFVQQSNILGNSATQFNTPPFPHGAPPPYPYVQSHVPRENPPPYVP